MRNRILLEAFGKKKKPFLLFFPKNSEPCEQVVRMHGAFTWWGWGEGNDVNPKACPKIGRLVSSAHLPHSFLLFLPPPFNNLMISPVLLRLLFLLLGLSLSLACFVGLKLTVPA